MEIRKNVVTCQKAISHKKREKETAGTASQNATKGKEEQCKREKGLA